MNWISRLKISSKGDEDMNSVLPKSQEVHNMFKGLFLDKSKMDSSGKPLPDTKFYLARGITKQVALDPTKLNDAKLSKIKSWKSEMNPKFETTGHSYKQIACDASGKSWCNDDATIAEEFLFLLMVSGYATIMTETPSVFLPDKVPQIKVYKFRKPVGTTSMRELRASGITF